MTEQAAEPTTVEAPAEQPQEGAEQQEAKTFDADYVEKLRKEAAQHRTEKNALAKELEKVRQSSMSEAEKQVAEAEARGRAAASADFGKRLATSEIRAAAADAQADLTGVFDYLDLSRFVGDDGEPDEKAIKAFVGGLPKKDAGPPSFDGGTRTTAPAPVGMSQIIRKAAGRA